jgi:hypothetical protein
MSKEIGNYGELRFALSSFENGFSVLQPFSDSRPYDFVLEKQGRFLRVQVKTCGAPLDEKGCFRFGVGHGKSSKKIYTSEHTDIIVCYIKSLDIFYLIPIQLIDTVTIRLRPFKEDSKLIKFKNNWNI